MGMNKTKSGMMMSPMPAKKAMSSTKPAMKNAKPAMKMKSK